MRTIDLNNDLDVLFGTIIGEAESEVAIGKVAVGWSVMNRVAMAGKHPHFGDGTVRSVCLFPSQYDCWNKGPDRDRIMKLNLDFLTPIQQQAMQIAKDVIAKKTIDVTGGATYYYQKDIPAPPWVPGAIFCGLFGTQIFWRGIK
jgi:spore germination cell wall hydrolase CwlJ-like protein